MCRGKKRADGRLAEEERQQQQEEERQAEAERKAAKLQAYNDRKNQQRGGGAEADAEPEAEPEPEDGESEPEAEAEPAGTDNNAAAKSRSRGKARGGGGEEPTSNRLFSSMNKTKAERRCGQRMAFAPLLYENAMILPRQTRDKDRESTQNKDVFSLGRGGSCSHVCSSRRTRAATVSKKRSLSPLLQ